MHIYNAIISYTSLQNYNLFPYRLFFLEDIFSDIQPEYSTFYPDIRYLVSGNFTIRSLVYTYIHCQEFSINDIIINSILSIMYLSILA